VAFVHMSSEEEAAPWFERAGLGDVLRVSDPDRVHYRAFGLATTGWVELLKPRVWVRGAASNRAHGFGWQPSPAIRQLPGVFVVHGRRVLAAFRHTSPSDRPDYLALLAAATSGVTMP
jgi:hypothetical protein